MDSCDAEQHCEYNSHFKSDNSACIRHHERITYGIKCFTGKPGLVDPLSITQICLSVLNGRVHIGPPLVNKSHEPLSQNKQICEGIRIYFEKWEPDPEIEKDVEHYIKYPCVMEVADCIGNSTRKALKFLLSYLRQRGPFINWIIRPGTDLVMGRCISTVFTGYLRQLDDLTFTSALLIGRYLHYLISVGCAQDLFYLRKIVSKVWGPIFIKCIFDPECEHHGPLTEEQKINFTISLFSQIIENAPWSSFTPFEGVDKILMEESKSHFNHYNRDENLFVLNKLKIPKQLCDTMSDTIKKQTIQNAIENHQHCHQHFCNTEHHKCDLNENKVLQNKQEILLNNISEKKSTFPSDYCRLK